MTPVELVICLLLLLLSVPDLCTRLGRPALAYVVYLVAGSVLGPLLDERVAILLSEIGKVGFVLLLFEVGLDINLPPLRHWWTPLKLVLRWVLPQIPVAMGLARVMGMSDAEALIAAVALNGCAVGMVYPAWQAFATPGPENKQHLLLWIITLEVMAILVLTATDIVIKRGIGIAFLLQLVVVFAVVIVISLTADRLTRWTGRFVIRSSKWRSHMIVLLVLVVSALAGRAGLSPPKAAFLLGLFISRTTHEGFAITRHIHGIGQRLLIPAFFLSLGASIPISLFTYREVLFAFGAMGLLFGLRDFLHRTWAKSGCAREAFLLACPNLTVVSIAAQELLHLGTHEVLVGWLVLTGAIMSAAGIVLLPGEKAAPPKPASDETEDVPK